MNSTLAPWLSVVDAMSAEAFYKLAFDATTTYRMETPDGGLVVRLKVGDAEFWVSGHQTDSADGEQDLKPGNTMKLILTVANPDESFQQAIDAGGTVVFPVDEAYGWRLGRMVDPFGFHWEIGKQIE